jgi:hypothetical protein
MMLFAGSSKLKSFISQNQAFSNTGQQIRYRRDIYKIICVILPIFYDSPLAAAEINIV